MTVQLVDADVTYKSERQVSPADTALNREPISGLHLLWLLAVQQEAVLASDIDTDFAKINLLPHETSVNGSTGYTSPNHFLYTLLNGYIADASKEIFENGMDSVFSTRIECLLSNYGDLAVSVLDGMLDNNVDVEVASEALATLGSIDDTMTHDARRTTLLHKLFHADYRIRDAALMGLASLNDTSALDGLRRAADRETTPWVKRNFGTVIEQMQTI